MPDGVAVRRGVAAVAPHLAHLHLAARAAAMPWLREAYGEAEVAAWLAGDLVARHNVRVATLNGRPVGYIGFGRDQVHGPMVLHLYLDPDSRRRGIGRPLPGVATAALGQHLSVFRIARNDAARAFYEGHSFRIAATSDGAGTEEVEPDILYVRAGAPSGA